MARASDTGKNSRLLVMAALCVVVAALFFAREVLVPLALAMMVSFLLSPAVRWLEKLRLKRAPAVLIVVTIAVIAVVLVGYMVYRQGASIVEQLPNYRTQLSTKVGRFKQRGNIVNKAEQELKAIGNASATQPVHGAATQASSAPGQSSDLQMPVRAGLAPSSATQPSVENPLPVRVVSEAATPFAIVQDYGSRLLSPLADAGLVLIIVIFMLLDREDLRDRMLRLLGHGRLNVTTQALDEASTRISKYLSRLGIVNALYAVFTAAGLWIIGHFLGKGTAFPNVLVWGLLVGLFRFVPYVGIWIGAAFPLLLSFALFPGNSVFFSTIGLFAVLELSVSQFIEPYWYGASTGMTPLAVLVAAVFWTWLWGPIGLLLSTPLTVCLVVIGKHVPQLKFIDILLRDTPVLAPHLRFYQRLIAEDEEEATDLAHSFLEDKTLEQMYDEVLLPALSLAVLDHHHLRLDNDRFAGILQNMREISEELVDRVKADDIREQAAATVESAKSATPQPKRHTSRLPHVPKDCIVNVLCLPARDEADEVAAMMLSQLLELRGYCVSFASAARLASEMVEMVQEKKTEIVCVSAMPPAAVAHARYLCKRLHGRYGDKPMVIGLWTFKGDVARAKERISCSDAGQIAATLADAQDRIEELAHPLIVGATIPQAPTPELA